MYKPLSACVADPELIIKKKKKILSLIMLTEWRRFLKRGSIAGNIKYANHNYMRIRTLDPGKANANAITGCTILSKY